MLAGGASRRFSADKAQFRLYPDGPTMLESVLYVARKLTPNVVIVGHRRYHPLAAGVPILSEADPGRGPLPAIETALSSTSASRVLVLACDMPCLSIPLLAWMARLRTGADAVVPRTNDGRWHPLHAIYSSSCLPAIHAAQVGGKRSANAFYQDILVQAVTEKSMRLLDPSLCSLFSLNSPDEVEQARLCARFS